LFEIKERQGTKKKEGTENHKFDYHSQEKGHYSKEENIFFYFLNKRILTIHKKRAFLWQI